MRAVTLLALATVNIFSPALAGTPGQPDLSPGDQCRVAIATAERVHALPSRLLAAIGQVESGRRDPQTKQWTPWPWTIDVGGEARVFASKEDAVAAVRELQAKGVRSIDVGCVQINLAWHSNAFRTLEDAFDPETNTRYGAEFLQRLFAITKDWQKAAALYHSATPALGSAYAQKVLAAFSGRGVAPMTVQPSRPLILPPTAEQQLAVAWAATLNAGTDSSSSSLGWTAGLIQPASSPLAAEAEPTEFAMQRQRHPVHHPARHVVLARRAAQFKGRGGG
jgi:hypothetical protein